MTDKHKEIQTDKCWGQQFFYVLIRPLQDKTDISYPTVAKLNYTVYRHMTYEQNLYFKKKIVITG
jgi:hypothetical protein